MIKIITFFVVFLAISNEAIAVQSLLPDPTQPIDTTNISYDEENENPLGIRINSILVAPDRKIAMVNRHYLQESDRIGDFIVINIYPNAIRLKDSTGDEFIVKMPYSNIKQSIANAAIANRSNAGENTNAKTN